MFPILSIIGQVNASAVVWKEVLNMKFNNNFTDSTGRHTPVSYGAATSSAQSVEGGYSLFTQADGRVFTDDFGGDNADFDFVGKNFKIECSIHPTSYYDRYVWMKSSGNEFGITLLINDAGGGNSIIYMRGRGNVDLGLGAVVPSLLNKWTKLTIKRELNVWTLAVNGAVVATTTWPETSMPTSGTGYNGFTIAGAANSNRFTGYIDNFVVQTKIPIDFFIIVGQSNAEGRGDSTLSPASPHGIYVNSSGDITALADPVGGATTGSMWPTFSNEWYTLTGRSSAFIERATGGTALIPDQAGSNWSPSGTLRSATVNAATTALNALLASEEYALNNVYFVWCQGEADAQAVNGTTITGAIYKTALEDLATYFKAQMPQMLSIGVIQSGRYSTMAQAAAWAEIRQAQDDACTASDLLAMLYRGAASAAVMGQMADTVHWTQAVLNMAGKAAARELLNGPTAIPAAPAYGSIQLCPTPDTTATATRTVSHTTAAGTNFVIVPVSSMRLATNTTFTITGVTFNGVAMRELREHNAANGSPACRVNIAVYYIDEAMYGGSLSGVTGNVVITSSNTANVSDFAVIDCTGDGYPDAYAIANASTGNSLTTQITTNASSLIVTVGACVSSTITIPTATVTGATEVMDHGLATTKGGSFVVAYKQQSGSVVNDSCTVTWSTSNSIMAQLSVSFRGKISGESSV